MIDPDKIELKSSRDGYGQGLLWLGEHDSSVVVLTGDLSESTRSNWFAEKYPKRFIQCGVAEQNMMGIAAGLGLSGKTAFVSSYAVFNPGRNWDQLRVSVCYSKAKVVIAGSHAGISVGPDGATHQGLEDIALARVLPDLTVIAPADFEETKKATIAAAQEKGPVYIRFSREKFPMVTTANSPFKIGRAEVLMDGTDVAIIACGPLVFESLLAAQELAKQGISCTVIDNHTIKPIDRKTVVSAARKCKAVVTAEEHQVDAGMGSAVLEVLAEEYPVPAERVGMPNCFGESGQAKELMEKYGMGKSAIIKAVKKVLKRKAR